MGPTECHPAFLEHTPSHCPSLFQKLQWPPWCPGESCDSLALYRDPRRAGSCLLPNLSYVSSTNSLHILVPPHPGNGYLSLLPLPTHSCPFTGPRIEHTVVIHQRCRSLPNWRFMWTELGVSLFLLKTDIQEALARYMRRRNAQPIRQCAPFFSRWDCLYFSFSMKLSVTIRHLGTSAQTES